MSATALLWVSRVIMPVFDDLEASEIAALWALAHHHNQETGRCNPTIETLGKSMGCGERKVRYGLKGLERRKVIKIKRNRPKGKRQYYPNTYIFRPAIIAKLDLQLLPHNKGNISTPKIPSGVFDLVIDETLETNTEFEIEDSTAQGLGMKVIGGEA